MYSLDIYYSVSHREYIFLDIEITKFATSSTDYTQYLILQHRTSRRENTSYLPQVRSVHHKYRGHSTRSNAKVSMKSQEAGNPPRTGLKCTFLPWINSEGLCKTPNDVHVWTPPNICALLGTWVKGMHMVLCNQGWHGGHDLHSLSRGWMNMYMCMWIGALIVKNSVIWYALHAYVKFVWHDTVWTGFTF